MSPARLAGPALLLALAGYPGPLGAQPPRRPELGTLQVRSFFSPALGARKRYLVYLPPSYARRRGTRYSVAYLLHGRTGNEADWVVRGDLDVVADSLFGREQGMILVMPDGDNSFWVNWTESPGYAACAADTLLTEAAPSFCVPHERYGDYVARDLVAEIDARFPTLADRSHRGLIGLSMGGTGALTLALTYPEVFAAVTALSGVASPFYLGPRPYQPPARQATSLAEIEQDMGRKLTPVTRARWGADTNGWWRHDPERAALRLRRAGAALPAIRLDVGRRDPYLDQNRALDAALRRLAAEHEYLERDGGHEWSYWRAHLGETLDWTRRRLAPLR
jgi:putative tributyrin esterase